MNCTAWLLTAALAFSALPDIAHAETAFTYQGRLSTAGTAAQGSYDFQFVFHCANLPRFLSRRFRHPNRRLENLDHCPVLLGLRAFHFA